MANKVTLSVRVERDLLEDFIAAANRSGSSGAAIMRTKIKDLVRKQSRKRRRAAAKAEESGAGA
jgi:hypothetical protein